MAAAPPRAIVFDIGGVLVNSPMAAILSYEQSLGIPPGWVNFSISRSGQQGAWQRLERGEVPLDKAWFAQFEKDLTRPQRWSEFLDMLSDKARTANREGDERWLQSLKSGSPPHIEAEKLYWSMMDMSRTPDVHMLAAVKRLKKSKRFLIVALSNTSIFPADHPLSKPIEDPELDYKSQFDIFISSAHEGLRKPDEAIYEFAMKKMQATQGFADLKDGEVLFLDDIGANLRPARKRGWQTIKVALRGNRDAVKELEKVTGEKLLDGSKL